MFKKSCNFSKILSVLLSASVERVGVSRMLDFFFMFLVLEDLNFWNCDADLELCILEPHNYSSPWSRGQEGGRSGVEGGRVAAHPPQQGVLGIQHRNW